MSFSHLHSSGYYIDPVRPKVRLVRRDPSSSPNGPIDGGFLSPRTSPLFFFLFILVYRKPTHFVIMIKATRYSNTLSIMMSSSFFIISRSFIPSSILQVLCPFSQQHSAPCKESRSLVSLFFVVNLNANIAIKTYQEYRTFVSEDFAILMTEGLRA